MAIAGRNSPLGGSRIRMQREAVLGAPRAPGAPGAPPAVDREALHSVYAGLKKPVYTGFKKTGCAGLKNPVYARFKKPGCTGHQHNPRVLTTIPGGRSGREFEL